jgi:hypothetical protein
VLWRARLEGEVLDLQALATFFDSDDPKVGESNGYYFLRSSTFDDAEAANSLPKAECLISAMNGAVKVVDTSFRPVRLDGQFVDADGNVTIMATGHLEMRAQARATAHNPSVVIDSEPQPPSDASRWVELAKNDASVMEVLVLLDDPAPDWFALYKVLEIVSVDVGGEAVVRERGWASAGDLSAFRAGSNHPAASGREARHARLPGGPPRTAFEMGEGRNFISTLVKHWFESKLASRQ